ncbi:MULTISPECIES: hypothetical protein [unclassified Streptomyces]|uniref:hypothetical protein n=1 Tax=unclassified Streptomyces TaxID=2593676 RepID=UPI0004BE0A45|nr:MULTISPECIES: hypothetical protein [unclassified Streptomyces]
MAGSGRGRLEDETAPALRECRGRAPAFMPLLAPHPEMHRGLMPARSGDTVAGTTRARTALDTLPPEMHSLTSCLLMTEAERS